jgi:type II secretory pathway pseudopilin PulG
VSATKRHLQLRAVPATVNLQFSRPRQRDGGYLLLAILLMMALMIIAATITAPRVVQQIKRDREEEMIHRGTEYARAIKKFYKKFGRYPGSLEQLENTNEIRFLRKRYKDPLTKDGKWGLLHYGDIQNLINPNSAGTPAAGNTVTPGGALIEGVPSPGLNGRTSQQAINGSGSSLFNQNPALSGPAGNAGGTTITAALSGSGDNTGGTPGNFTLPPDNSGGFAAGQTGSAPSSFNQGSDLAQGTNGPPNPGEPPGSTFGQNTAATNQTFGAGAIVGVASLSKDPTIRIYNKKKKYNEWQFIYNPTNDAANVLLRGPYQPTTIGGTQVGTPAGQLAVQQPGSQQPAPVDHQQ